MFVCFSTRKISFSENTTGESESEAFDILTKLCKGGLDLLKKKSPAATKHHKKEVICRNKHQREKQAFTFESEDDVDNIPNLAKKSRRPETQGQVAGLLMNI